MTQTYFQKPMPITSITTKGQPKSRDHNPLKIRLGTGTESLTSISKSNISLSRGKLLTEAASLAKLETSSNSFNRTQVIAHSSKLRPRMNLNLSQNPLNFSHKLTSDARKNR